MEKRDEREGVLERGVPNIKSNSTSLDFTLLHFPIHSPLLAFPSPGSQGSKYWSKIRSRRLLIVNSPDRMLSTSGVYVPNRVWIESNGVSR